MGLGAVLAALAVRGAAHGDAPVAVYGRRRVRRRLAVGAVVATGTLGFAVAAAAMTLPELVAGRSLGGGDRQTTLFGGEPRGGDDAGPTTSGETTPETTATETTPARETEATPTPQQQPQYQPRRSETLPAAPSSPPTEATPAPTETAPSSAQQP